jgi:hypothetical protein
MPMLLIVDALSRGDSFPVDSLKEVDAALATLGFKKEIHSVVKPGKQYSLTYEGPSTEKSRIEDTLRPVAEKNNIGLSFEVEESVKFP